MGKLTKSVKIPNVQKCVLKWEFDIAIEGKNVQHVIKPKNKWWSLISELRDKNVIMQKFGGKIVIFQKVGWWIILINVNIKWVKFTIIDQERREEYIKRGKEKIVE